MGTTYIFCSNISNDDFALIINYGRESSLDCLVLLYFVRNTQISCTNYYYLATGRPSVFFNLKALKRTYGVILRHDPMTYYAVRGRSWDFFESGQKTQRQTIYYLVTYITTTFDGEKKIREEYKLYRYCLFYNIKVSIFFFFFTWTDRSTMIYHHFSVIGRRKPGRDSGRARICRIS